MCLSPAPRDISVSALRAKDIPTHRFFNSKFQLIDSDKFELKNTTLDFSEQRSPRQRPFCENPGGQFGLQCAKSELRHSLIRHQCQCRMSRIYGWTMLSLCQRPRVLIQSETFELLLCTAMCRYTEPLCQLDFCPDPDVMPGYVRNTSGHTLSSMCSNTTPAEFYFGRFIFECNQLDISWLWGLLERLFFEAQESQEECRTCRTCRKLSEWRDWMMSDAFLAAMMSRVDRCSPRSLLLLTWDTIFCEVVLFVHAINVNHSESFLMNCFTISLPLFFDSNFLCCSNDFARCLYFFSWTNLTAQLTATEKSVQPRFLGAALRLTLILVAEVILSMWKSLGVFCNFLEFSQDLQSETRKWNIKRCKNL